jgi:DNA polymerase I-like protein with 3'-5' exonuclease and polymerase domains/uracil-DNA glycosylase
MPTISLPEKPAPFSCRICEQPEHKDKAGPSCTGCPAFHDAHYFPHTVGDSAPDVLFVAEAPVVQRLNLVKRAQHEGPYHIAFEDDGGRVLQTSVNQLKAAANRRHLQVRYVYAVKCAVDNPNRQVITSCQTYLMAELAKVHAAREAVGKRGELIVVALGTRALTALGVAAESEEKCIGRDWHVQHGPVELHVFFTRSLKSIAAATGKHSAMLNDLENAFRAATGETIAKASRDELMAGYVFPTKLSAVRELVDYIKDYSENGIAPLQWAISADTETNTLHPYRPGLLLTTFSFSWATGKACAIPLFIPKLHEPYTLDDGTEMPPFVDPDYDPMVAWEIVKELLACGKPIIGHNFKYDLKVVWAMGWDVKSWGWDVMSAEHVLEEDKKGFYSLKKLAAQFLPRYAGYEDRLHEMLEADEDAGRVATKVGKTVVKVPEGVLQALQFAAEHKMIAKPTGSFRISSLEKKLRELEANIAAGVRLPLDEDLVKSCNVLIGAKTAGEFKKEGTAERRIKKGKGGFENVRIDELLFYAAIDADVTRQLAVQQVGRMHEEQARIEEYRRFIDIELRHAGPSEKKYFVPRLCDDPDPLRTLVKQHYVPRGRELCEIEYRGIRVDRAYLEQGLVDLETVTKRTEEQVYSLAGERFPLNSTKKLSKLLFDTGVGYKHPVPEQAEKLAREFPDEVKFVDGRIMYRAHHFTEKGAEQTGEAVLKSLVQKYQDPMANLLMSFKKAHKMRTSFFRNAEGLSRTDGFLRSGYNLNGTGTGRLSSSSKEVVDGAEYKFNMQNITKGLVGAFRDMAGNMILGEDGKPLFAGVNCKKLFIPDDDSYAFVNADAKGAEVSVYSAYSKDAALIEALIGGLDSHCFFGSKCLSPDQVARDEAGNRLEGEARRLALARAGIDDEHAWSYEDFLQGKDGLLADKDYGKRLKVLRDNIKRLVFGLLYGAGVRKIADIAGIPLALAETIKKLLFDMFPSIPAFLEQTKWELKTFGLVETFDGRRRRFSIKNAPSSLRAQAERRCINFKVQGTNSDIVMKVLVNVAPIIRDLGGRLLLTVHDSIGFQIPKRHLYQMPDVFKEYGTVRVARECPWMPVPYRWDMTCGDSYAADASIEDYIKNLPKKYQTDLDGYTEEEVFDSLREATDEPAPKKHKKKS